MDDEIDRVFVISPFQASSPQEKKRFRAYLLRALRHTTESGEAGFAAHALYPQFMNDDDWEERRLAILYGTLWLRSADLLAVYADYGITPGMMDEIAEATRLRIPVDVRYILRGKRCSTSSPTPVRNIPGFTPTGSTMV